VVLVELGGNDLLGGATVEAFAANLRRLFRQTTGEGRSLVMFELPLLPLQNRYGKVQRQVSAEFGVRLIPRRILAGAVALPGHTTDGLHLSATGHRWLAEKLVAWL
jgi:lysophospholipase L1-like esterase